MTTREKVEARKLVQGLRDIARFFAWQLEQARAKVAAL